MADFLEGRPQNQSIGAGIREYLNTENSDPGTMQRLLGNLFGNASELAGLDQPSINMRNLEDDYINNYYAYMMQTGSKEMADEAFPSAADLMVSRSTEMMPMGSVGGKMPRKATPDAVIKQVNPKFLPDFDVRTVRKANPNARSISIPPEKIPQQFPDEGTVIPGYGGERYNVNMLRDMDGNLVPYSDPERIRWDRLTQENIEKLLDHGYTQKYIEYRKFMDEKKAFQDKIRNIATGTGIAGILGYGANELGNYLDQTQDYAPLDTMADTLDIGPLYSDTAQPDTSYVAPWMQQGNTPSLSDIEMWRMQQSIDSADNSINQRGGIDSVPIADLQGYADLLERQRQMRGF